VTAFSSRDLLL